MEKRNTNYLVILAIKSGKGKQKFKKIEKRASSLKEARILACELSTQYQYSSTVILESQNLHPVEFWSSGRQVG